MDNGQYLSEKEITDFTQELDKDADGCISYSEIEQKLDVVSHELDPVPKEHHLHHESNGDHERHVFLRGIMASEKDSIPANQFAQTVKFWDIPSLKQTKDSEEEEEKSYMKNWKLARKLRAHWEVDRPQYMFLALVISMQLAFGIWQLVKYLTEMQYRYALFIATQRPAQANMVIDMPSGWGVVLARLQQAQYILQCSSWSSPCQDGSPQHVIASITSHDSSTGIFRNRSTSKCQSLHSPWLPFMPLGT
jgi:hypothetical protein